MLLLLLACTDQDSGKPTPVLVETADTTAETGSLPEDSAQPDSADSGGEPEELDTDVYYVSPSGDDGAEGSLDAPWGSLEGAAANLRALRAAGALDRPVEVELAAGTWSLTEPWTLSPEDSGEEASPVTWRAPLGEAVVISGGITLDDWRADGEDLVTTLPEGAPAPAHLWVEEERRTRAHEPDEDWFYAAGTPADLYGSLIYAEGEIDPDWDLSNALVHTAHDVWGAWETSWLWVASHDAATHTLSFSGASIWGQYATNRWRLENVPEALDSAGEWFYDVDTRELRYRPMDGETAESLVAIVPIVERLLEIAGAPEEDDYVRYLNFEGLTFAYTDWAPDEDGYAGLQAAVTEGAAIEVTGGRQLRLEGISVTHTGAHGIWLREGTRDTQLIQSELGDLGAGAVRLGTTTEADDSGSNTVENCFLHHGGRTLPAGQGVWIGQSSHNDVISNEIADFYYSGVQVGWYWGYASTTAEDNRIAYNHIHTIGQGVLSDLGGVYTLGVSPGTVVEHNVIHDISSYGYGGWGLYTDEGSSFVTLTHNLVYNASSESFHQHYGEANVVTNNILAYASGAQVRRSKAEEHTSFFFYNNIIYFDNGDPLYDGGYSDWTPGRYDMNYNVWYDPTACALDWAGYSWEDWQALGNDTASVVADPLFADPGALDFTLSPDSPAIALGFEPLDPTEAGLYGDEAWTSRPLAYGWTSTTHSEAAGEGAVDDDFEDTEVGEAPADVTIWGDTDSAWIRVTDAEAYSGDRSLELQDQPGLAAAYAPHFWYTPSLCGELSGRFAVKVGADAMFYHEWRDWPSGSSYLAGPSVTVDADGVLYASWVPVGAVPLGEWLLFEIAYTVGDTRWSFTVTEEDGTTQTFSDLSASALTSANWIGFVANADAEAQIWLDDLSVE